MTFSHAQDAGKLSLRKSVDIALHWAIHSDLPMKPGSEPVTFESIADTHRRRCEEIRQRLSEFEAVWREGDDTRLWEEMVYCFFTGGRSATMGLRSVEAIRPLLAGGSQPEIADALKGVHRYPNSRSRYVQDSRSFLN